MIQQGRRERVRDEYRKLRPQWKDSLTVYRDLVWHNLPLGGSTLDLGTGAHDWLGKELTRAGLVSRGQFRSLFAVCRRMNGEREFITREQFIGLFDGSLLWRAASMTNSAGRRAPWLQPAAHLR